MFFTLFVCFLNKCNANHYIVIISITFDIRDSAYICPKT